MRCSVGVGSLLISTLLALGPARADEPHQVTPGTLCRVTAPTLGATPLIGTLVESTDLELIFAGPEIGRRAIPRGAVTRLEWSSGRRSRTGRFALYGALLGVALGAGTNYADPQGECTTNKGSCAVLGGLLGGVLLGATGAVVGLAVRTYDWKETSPPRSNVSVSPAIVPGEGAGVAVVLRW